MPDELSSHTMETAIPAWAKQLGRPDCANLLHQTLEEERRTDEKLSQIAETRVNRKAA